MDYIGSRFAIAIRAHVILQVERRMGNIRIVLVCYDQ
jgi:hypothetical protein